MVTADFDDREGLDKLVEREQRAREVALQRCKRLGEARGGLNRLGVLTLAIDSRRDAPGVNLKLRA
jgi:hypothetical protein